MSGRERHIGYVLKRFPRISETFVAAEVIELERQGEHVTIFAVSRPEEPFSHAFLGELRARVVYLPYRVHREPKRVLGAVAHVVRSDARRWLGALASSLWPPRRVGPRHLLQATVLQDELRRAGITHVHAHFATTAARLAALARQMGGPTYSVTAHAKDIYHEDVETEHLRDKLGEASFVATVSEPNRVHLESVLDGLSPVHVVPNAVDLRRLDRIASARTEPGLVLSVARLVEKKGLGDLIAAVGILADSGVHLRLEIVGDGVLGDTLRMAAEGTSAEVVFHGALPNEQVLELYQRASVFALPCVVAANGDRDGLPTSVLEAMARGVPVVTTAVNGLGDVVIDRDTGLIVPEHDPDALAEAIGLLIRDRELAERLARSARQKVEAELSLERSVTALRRLFPEAA